jgi:hypothetical protein
MPPPLAGHTARRFMAERIAFMNHCRDVSSAISATPEMTAFQLCDWVAELESHLITLRRAGDAVIFDCCLSDLDDFPPGFFTLWVDRPGQPSMTEFVWGCVFTRHVLYQLPVDFVQTNNRLRIAADIEVCGIRWDLTRDFPTILPGTVDGPIESAPEGDGDDAPGSDDESGIRGLQLPFFEPSLQPR